MFCEQEIEEKTTKELINLLNLKEHELASKDDELASKDDELASKDDELASKDDELASKDDELASKDDELASKDDELASKDDELASKNYEIKLKKQEIIELKLKIEKIQSRLDLLLSEKYAKLSEKTTEPCEFNEATPLLTKEEQKEIEEAEEEISVVSKKTGRKKLPKEFSRKEIVHDVPDEDKICSCGCEKVVIGEETSEQMGYIPAKAYVIKHIRKKYVCKSCKEIIIAPPPLLPIPKSIASDGLLAQILVAKYCYHLPLYRQEMILKDAGIDIPRATVSSWVIKCAKLLQPLVNLLQDNIINHDVSYADETRVQVLKEANREPEKQSFMWSFAGGEKDKFSIVLQYSETRSHEVVVNFFGKEYKGYIHCDGYKGYEAYAKLALVILVGCFIHARRRFVAITKTTKKQGLAHYAIKLFSKLAKIEKVIKDNDYTYEQAKEYREITAKPILDKFKSWLDEKITQVPPSSAIGEAIQYSINQWPKLLNYLKDGRLEWSNNFSERIMKKFATGRKNWLFSNSVSGAHASSIIYSLVLTCEHHKIDVFQYFRTVLQKIPICKTVEDFENLLPYNIQL